MRVVIVDCAVSIGGTPIVSAHIASLLQLHGHAALVVTALEAADAAAVFPPDVRTVLLRHPISYDDARKLKIIYRDPSQPLFRRIRMWARNRFSAFTNLSYVAKLSRIVREFDADIVHVNNGFEPMMAAAVARVPSIHQVHGLYDPKLRSIDLMFLKLPKHFVQISEVVAESVRVAGIAAERMTVVPNFLLARKDMPGRSAARASLGLTEGPPVVAIVGRVVGWKGQLEFVRSMRHVADRIPNVQLLIAGSHSDGQDDYYQSVVDLAASLGLTQNTHFVGHLNDPYLAYRAADVVAHCSLDPEPFGMVLIEAMEAGTPVVAANSGGPLEIVEDGVSGFLADPRKPEEFARPIIELLSKPELAARISRGGLDRLRDKYSAEAVYPQLMGIYTKFARNRVARKPKLSETVL